MSADRNITGTIFNIQKFSVNDGPGIRTTVFLKGCPLRCLWCANPESQRPEPEILGDKISGELKTVQEVMDVVMQDLPFYVDSGGGLALSGGEMLLQPAFSEALLIAAKEEGLNTCCETTGFAAANVFLKVIKNADLLLFDLKHWEDAAHRKGTGVSLKLPRENMKLALKEGKEVLPRIPVIPGFNDSLEDAACFAETLAEIGAETCQLLPFHQFGENKYALLNKGYRYQNVDALHKEDLEDFRQIMISGGIRAFF